MERSVARVAVVSGGDYDLTTPDGRFTARIVGAVARKESEDRSRRVRRKHLELAEQGRSAGQLGWGVRTEAERELVREAAGRVLAGQGLMTIAKDWNQRGVPGATECAWTGPTLRKMLLSARVAGLRERKRDCLLEREGPSPREGFGHRLVTQPLTRPSEEVVVIGLVRRVGV